MGMGNREIEVKLLVGGDKVSYQAVTDAIRAVFGNEIAKVVTGSSTDTYWHPPKGSPADFARVRSLGNGRAQMTVKSSDRGSNLDRVEIDVEVKNQSQAIAFLTEFLGRPSDGSITKQYDVYFLGKETNVSVYQVEGSESVFIEIEGESKEEVTELVRRIMQGAEFKALFRVYSSLYEMYVQKAAPRRRVVTEASIETICGR